MGTRIEGKQRGIIAIKWDAHLDGAPRFISGRTTRPSGDIFSESRWRLIVRGTFVQSNGIIRNLFQVLRIVCHSLSFSPP